MRENTRFADELISLYTETEEYLRSVAFGQEDFMFETSDFSQVTYFKGLTYIDSVEVYFGAIGKHLIVYGSNLILQDYRFGESRFSDYRVDLVITRLENLDTDELEFEELFMSNTKISEDIKSSKSDVLKYSEPSYVIKIDNKAIFLDILRKLCLMGNYIIFTNTNEFRLKLHILCSTVCFDCLGLTILYHILLENTKANVVGFDITVVKNWELNLKFLNFIIEALDGTERVKDKHIELHIHSLGYTDLWKELSNEEQKDEVRKSLSQFFDTVTFNDVNFI